jgi:hypothetical protein
MYDSHSDSLKSPSNAEVGEHKDFDKRAVKGYVSESKVKRIVNQNKEEILKHLKDRFNIPSSMKVKTDGVYEDFDTIEVMKSKVTDFNSKKCIKLLEIYETKGLISLVNAIQYLSPIQKI